MYTLSRTNKNSGCTNADRCAIGNGQNLAQWGLTNITSIGACAISFFSRRRIGCCYGNGVRLFVCKRYALHQDGAI